MMKVLLIGDSIRMGYQPRVVELLDDTASVSGPGENCRFSAYTLFHLSTWAADDDYDVIHWNNGQWDTCYMPDGRIHTPLPVYLELQQRIAEILQPRTRRLVFATTSPVWPAQFDSGAVHPRRNEDIVAYNQAASELLAGMGIEINDLHAAIAQDVKKYISRDMVHLTEAGNDLCARKVVAAVRPAGD